MGAEQFAIGAILGVRRAALSPVARGRPGVWYHGGAAGLRPGDWILPPAETGAVTYPFDREDVWLTISLQEAVVWAVAAGGWVYRVRPEGTTTPAAERGAGAARCDRAEVLAVIPPEEWPPLNLDGVAMEDRRHEKWRHETWAPAPAIVRRDGTRDAVAATAAETWARCDRGHYHWGRFGAAGLLAYAPGDDGRLGVLLQKRGPRTDHGGTWGLLGGALREGEAAAEAALREACEESTLDPGAPRVMWRGVVDHGGWSYTTVAAALPERVPVEPAGWESSAVAWVDVDGVGSLRLHPGFAASWPAMRGRLAAG